MYIYHIRYIYYDMYIYIYIYIYIISDWSFSPLVCWFIAHLRSTRVLRSCHTHIHTHTHTYTTEVLRSRLRLPHDARATPQQLMLRDVCYAMS